MLFFLWSVEGCRDYPDLCLVAFSHKPAFYKLSQCYSTRRPRRIPLAVVLSGAWFSHCCCRVCRAIKTSCVRDASGRISKKLGQHPIVIQQLAARVNGEEKTSRSHTISFLCWTVRHRDWPVQSMPCSKTWLERNRSGNCVTTRQHVKIV